MADTLLLSDIEPEPVETSMVTKVGSASFLLARRMMAEHRHADVEMTIEAPPEADAEARVPEEAFEPEAKAEAAEMTIEAPPGQPGNEEATIDAPPASGMVERPVERAQENADVDAFLEEVEDEPVLSSPVDELIEEVLQNAETIRVSQSQKDLIVAAVDARARVVPEPSFAPPPVEEPAQGAIEPTVTAKEEKPERPLGLALLFDVIALAVFVGPAVYWLLG
jgi:hypothetical protein